MQQVSQGNVGTPIVVEWTRNLDTDPTTVLTVELRKPSGATKVIPAQVHPRSGAWFLALVRAGDLDELGDYDVRGREVTTTTNERTLPATLTVV